MDTLVYPPVAVLTASPLFGKAPLSVKFKDKSTGSPTFWAWDFGDKSTSTSKNLAHKSTEAGKHTVSLTVKNAAGNKIKTISSCIKVSNG
jgi:PKD repeat protein